MIGILFAKKSGINWAIVVNNTGNPPDIWPTKPTNAILSLSNGINDGPPESPPLKLFLIVN